MHAYVFPFKTNSMICLKFVVGAFGVSARFRLLFELFESDHRAGLLADFLEVS